MLETELHVRVAASRWLLKFSVVCSDFNENFLHDHTEDSLVLVPNSARGTWQINKRVQRNPIRSLMPDRRSVGSCTNIHPTRRDIKIERAISEQMPSGRFSIRYQKSLQLNNECYGGSNVRHTCNRGMSLSRSLRVESWEKLCFLLKIQWS